MLLASRNLRDREAYEARFGPPYPTSSKWTITLSLRSESLSQDNVYRDPNRRPAAYSVILPPRNNSQVYEENGRFYGTFRKGKYMFPVDEVGVPF